MAIAAGLDITPPQKYTNHSVRKTTVKKLKKGGASTLEIMAITGHKYQQSIADYNELDFDNHMRLGRILSDDHEKISVATSSAVETSTSSKSTAPSYLQSSTKPAVIFNMNNSTFNFGVSSSRVSQQTCSTYTPSCRV